jgi:Flp pilus assembly protein CpaB
MKPRAILIAALLLVVIVVAIIVGWATVGDRPGPMNSAGLYQSEDF